MQGNGIWAYQRFSNLNCASALRKGTPIGPRQRLGPAFAFLFEGPTITDTHCPWRTQGKKEAYLGLKFLGQGQGALRLGAICDSLPSESYG
jgi:hypothetical protein